MSAATVAGVVLAGGRGSRLGGSVPKPLADLGGRPLIAHALDRLHRLSPLLIAANDEDAFRAFGLPVLPDRAAGFQGPLSGLDAACAWLRRTRPDVTHLLAAPADTPFLPNDLADRLVASAGPRPALCERRGRLHPTVGLWPLETLDTLPRYLAETDHRSVMRFAEGGGFQAIPFDDGGNDPFFNVNTPADLAWARENA